MASSINIIVKRDDGDVPAQDIINPLITTEEVAISAGTQYLDKNNKNKTIISTGGPYHQWYYPGSLVEIIDSESVAYKAMVVGMGLEVNKSDTGFSVDANIQFEKVAV